jgi:hypothetical protein
MTTGTRIDYNTYINSPEWRAKANAAKQRAGNRCQVCNRPSSEIQLNAHHRTYERLGNENPDDITVLCRDCHKLFSDSSIGVHSAVDNDDKEGRENLKYLAYWVVTIALGYLVWIYFHPAPVPATTATADATVSPTNTPDPETFQVPRGKWIEYSNADMGFTAHIPLLYEPTITEPTQDDPSTTVLFSNRTHALLTPLIGTVSYDGALREDRLLAYFKDILDSENYFVVEQPSPRAVDGLPAFEATFEQDTSTGERIRVMMALVQGKAKTYNIAVWGDVDRPKEISWYFKNYVARFRVHDE